MLKIKKPRNKITRQGKNNGRPSKLTLDVQCKIVDLLRSGNYVETAAAHAGISKVTLFDWLRRGARSASGIYFDFLNSVERAMAEAESKDVQIITNAAENGVWQASAWRLERKFHYRWGRREKIEHTGKNDSPIEKKLTYNLNRLSLEERLQMKKMLEKARHFDP